VETLLARAEAYNYGGLHDRSLPLLRQIIEIDPVNQAAHWHLVLASFWAGEFERAVDEGDTYSQRFGYDQVVHTKVAHSYFVLGDDRGAREHYDKATSLPDPQYHDAFVFAGLLHDRTGERGRAEAVWRRGIELVEPLLQAEPDNVRMRLLLAIFHGLLGQKAAYAAELGRVMEAPDFNAFELYYLAAAQAAMSETEKAVDSLRRAMRRGRVSSAWKQYLKMTPAPLLESRSYTELLEEFEASDRRLRETY
jgi:tetratricopeptide (TPR) repeat protein